MTAATAKAAVLVAPCEIRVAEFPLPAVGHDDGLLRVEACGVCASDVPVYTGKVTYETPVILGHEIVGRVERLGARAADRWGIAEGDRIILERWIPCGHCDLCYAGNYRLCVPQVDGHPLFYGGSPTTLDPALWGGYAEYLYLHPDAVVYPVADYVPAEQFPLFTPLGNAISWVQKAGGAEVGSSVVIQGPGQEGLAAVLAARLAGATEIIVVGLARDAHRLKVAEELGATATFTVDEDDVVAGVAERTDGRMADVILDVTSTTSTQPFSLALDLCAVGATIVMAAHHDETMVDLPTTRLSQKTVTIKGVHGRDRDSLKAAIGMIESQQLPLSTLTTHHFGIEEVQHALQLVGGETDEPALHVSIVP